jgi:hypothetical protein
LELAAVLADVHEAAIGALKLPHPRQVGSCGVEARRPDVIEGVLVAKHADYDGHVPKVAREVAVREPGDQPGDEDTLPHPFVAEQEVQVA